MNHYLKSILIIVHMYEKSEKGGLPQEEVRNFLLDKSDKTTYLELPFPYAKVKRAYLTVYIKGKKARELKSPTIYGPEWLQYILHFFITIYLLLRTGASYDLCIAMDNLTALPVIPLRGVGIIKRLLYYSIDYTPKRFDNKILNSIYQFTNKIASQNADLNWAVSGAIVKEKKKRNILGNKKCLVVPVGFRGKSIKIPRYKKINKYHLVFVGILLEKQGVQLAIQSMPELVKKIPKLKLTIIGTGEHENSLKNLVKKLRVENKVRFTGFIKDHKDVEKILIMAGVGLAPYKPTKDNFTIYADPGKIKLYLGCGLPIVTTNVPQIAKELRKNKAGEVIKYNSESFIKAVEKIIKKHEIYRNSVIKMSKSYDYEVVYKKAFRNSNKFIVSQ
jgi:glycosyltransferase involved in cell wall biosynthesis